MWATPPDDSLVEHLDNGPMINHIKQENHEYKKIRFQILAQAPTNETNKEFWLKKTRIPVDMPIRHIK